MVGPNFRVGKKIGCGNFGELRLGEFLPRVIELVFFTIKKEMNDTYSLSEKQKEIFTLQT